MEFLFIFLTPTVSLIFFVYDYSFNNLFIYYIYIQKFIYFFNYFFYKTYQFINLKKKKKHDRDKYILNYSSDSENDQLLASQYAESFQISTSISYRSLQNIFATAYLANHVNM